MKNPVCNEHGNSYSREAYLKVLAKAGRSDPLTGKPLQTNLLYSNINLKKAIESFLE